MGGESANRFRRPSKEWEEVERKPYKEKKKEITGDVGKLKSSLGSNLHFQRVGGWWLGWGVSDFEGEEFYGFSVVLGRKG